MGKFLQDFKDFAMRGNVIDMAVGVIIGGAFGEIVSSLVKDVIMPVVGLATGGIDFSDMKVTLKEPVMDAAGQVASEAVTLNYGLFINYVVNFLIVAFCIFVAIRFMQKFRRKQEETPAAPPAPTKEEELLTEIRDLLAKKANESAPGK